MDAETLGNLLGRLVASSLIIYFCLLLISSFNFIAAGRKFKKPLSITFVVVIFVLGLSVNLQANSLRDRADRQFTDTEFIDVGVRAYVPSKPNWDVSTEVRSGAYALVLSTPELYFPPASLEIIHNSKLRVKEGGLLNGAISAANEVRSKSGLLETVQPYNLKPVSYGKMQGFRDEFTIDDQGKTYSVNFYFMLFKNRAPLTVFSVTSEGQMAFIEHTVEKILQNMSPLTGHAKSLIGTSGMN